MAEMFFKRIQHIFQFHSKILLQVSIFLVSVFKDFHITQ